MICYQFTLYSCNQSLKAIDLQELFGISIPVPLHPITEPTYLQAALILPEGIPQDSSTIIHKRETMKSGDDWCQIVPTLLW